MTRTVHYFPLEEVKSRYTSQLCSEWIPDAFNRVAPDWSFVPVVPDSKDLSKDIKTGHVLDATARSVFSLRQCEKFVKALEAGIIHKGDVIYLQDFWTPGLQSIMYAMELHDIRLPIFAMCHAQSVDEFDFTYPMRDWMRPAEHMLDRWMTKHGGAIMVASTIHKEMLREAEFNAKIHVIGLPFHPKAVRELVGKAKPPVRKQRVIYTSRLHPEKDPALMVEAAREILADFDDMDFVITTSHDELQGTDGAKRLVERLVGEHKGRVHIKTGLSKKQYYRELQQAKYQLNTSKQDFISWTLLEALTFGCIPIYPDFRSFPEILPQAFRYCVQNRTNAGYFIKRRIKELEDADDRHKEGQEGEKGIPRIPTIIEACNTGRLMVPYICTRSFYGEEINLWNSENIGHFLTDMLGNL